MTREDDFIGQLEGYLDEFEGVTPLPDAVRNAVRAQLPTTKQIGPTWWSMRQLTMNRPLQIAVTAVAAAAIVLVGVELLPGPNVGVEPSASPSTFPSTAADDALSGFLQARIAGAGAQQYLNDPEADVPLLYTTTSGAPYQRGEFEPVLGIDWPYGWRAFKVRLFAADTVVEQLFFAGTDSPLLSYQPDGFGTAIAPTTEDGKAVVTSHSFFDGEVTLNAAHPWIFLDPMPFRPNPFGWLIPEGPGVPPTTDGGERNDWDQLHLMADPSLVGTGCQTGPDPANAAGLAESIRSDSSLEKTAPVAVSVGGAAGLMMDLVVPAGANVCWNMAESGDPTDHPGVLYPVWDKRNSTTAGNGHASGQASGKWMRLYLFDVPKGSSIRILGIAIVAPESTFDRATVAAVPVVDSVEFHVP